MVDNFCFTGTKLKQKNPEKIDFTNETYRCVPALDTFYWKCSSMCEKRFVPLRVCPVRWRVKAWAVEGLVLAF